MHLSQYLFWDTDPAKVDFEKNARWVISRVFSRGSILDVRRIQEHYGSERILSEMLQAPYLDKITLNFLSLVYNVPKEKFRCYKKMQSSQEPWIF